MADSSLISIIIPAYNYGRFISETLESVQSQTYTNWECLIIDDGSTDDTKNVVSDFLNDNRFKYLYKTNGGLSSARNYGLKNAKGDYIQFLDADDLIQKRKLESQIACFQSDPAADIVYSEARFFASENKNELYLNILKRNEPPKNADEKDILNALVINNVFPVNCALIKSRVTKELIFDENLRALEDWDFWIKCAEQNYKFIPGGDSESFALIRVHSGSMSKSFVNMKKLEYDIRRKNKRKFGYISFAPAHAAGIKKYRRELLGLSYGYFKRNDLLGCIKLLLLLLKSLSF